MTISILTQHIKNYETNLSQQVSDALAKLLRSELHKRGLWTGEPCWLGVEYSNFETWENKKAFNDLLFHCYIYAILERKQSLYNALKKYEIIDPLINLNIKHFLDELHKKNDPLSYAVGSNVKTTIEKAIKAKILVNQSGKLNTKTLLSFSKIASHPVPFNYKQLQQSFYTIKGWQEICIKLVQNTPIAQNLFYQFICNLGKNSNITCFYYGDLMKIMKAETRELYNFSYSNDKNIAKNELNDDNEEITLVTNPNTSFEDWENWMHSIKQIRQNIDEQSWQQRVKKGARDVFDKLVELVETDEPIPSLAELANSLNIQSPQTVKNYLKRLQKIGALKILPEKNG